MKHIILKPIITEKSMQDAQKGRFTFEVAKSAGKNTIRQAVEELFAVKVVDLITTINKGKTKRAGKQRLKVSAASYKRAVIQLQDGQKISLFDLGA